MSHRLHLNTGASSILTATHLSGLPLGVVQWWPNSRQASLRILVDLRWWVVAVEPLFGVAVVVVGECFVGVAEEPCAVRVSGPAFGLAVELPRFDGRVGEVVGDVADERREEYGPEGLEDQDCERYGEHEAEELHGSSLACIRGSTARRGMRRLAGPLRRGSRIAVGSRLVRRWMF